MKKLFTLLSLLALIGLSANVFAQTNSGITPFVGTPHNYKVDSHAGSSYLWSVTEDFAGNTAAAVATITNGTTNEATITWDSPTPGATYYVHVVETDAKSCSNHKVIAVVPVNAFELLFVNTATDGTDQAVDAAYELCSPDVIVQAYNGSGSGTLADATNFTYNYGTTYLYYHITATGLNTNNTDWTVTVSPSIAAAIDGTVTAQWGTYDGTTWTMLEDDDAISSSDFSYTASGTDNIYLRLAVAHGTTYEGTADAAITLSVTGQDENGNAVTDVNSKSATSDSESQTILARPDTGNDGDGNTSIIGTTAP